MAKGILAQAQARLPSNMGGSQGAVRDVPASFTGGQGQSLGIFQPKKGGGGGGGGRLRLPKKKLPPQLKKEWEEQMAALKDAVNKGYISKEDAAKLAEDAKVLYTELGDKWGKPNEYSQALRNAASKYGSNATLGVSTGSILEGIIDYNVAKAISEGRAPAGANLPGDPRNYQTVEQANQARDNALQQALTNGDWERAQQLGATDTQMINAGAKYAGTTLIQEGPESYQQKVWVDDPTSPATQAREQNQGFVSTTPGGEEFTISDDTLSIGDEDFSIDELEEHIPGWDDPNDDPFNVGDFINDAPDIVGYDPDDSDTFSETDSWDSDSGYGVGNKGGVIRKAGGGNVTVDPRGFPGKPMGTDRVPVWAEEGEYIVTREGTQKFKPLLDKINAYRPPSGTVDGAMSQMDDLINKYAQGGKV